MGSQQRAAAGKAAERVADTDAHKKEMNLAVAAVVQKWS
jgi:hypothetical protein